MLRSKTSPWPACKTESKLRQKSPPLNSWGSASGEGKGRWHPRGGAQLDDRPGGEEGEELDLETFPTVALRAIPLDDDHPKVQQEDIASVKAVPAHFHLRVSSQSGSGQS